jgi:tetratricopeptide (TPR) repeat protein
MNIARDFVGRLPELQQLREALAERHSVITVIGMPGQGKSSLLGEWYREDERGLSDRGVFWCRPYEVGYSFASFLTEVLPYLTDGTVDLRQMPSTLQQAEYLCNLLRQRPTILVMDGIERWLRRWTENPDAVGTGASVQDRRATDQALDLLLEDAASWHNGSVLIITTRGLPAVLDDRPHVTIGTGGGDRSRFLEGLDPNDAVLLLKKLSVKGSDGALLTAADEYDRHPFSLTVLGNLLTKGYGGSVSARPKVDPLRDDQTYKLQHLLDRVMDHHRDTAGLLSAVACCVGPAPVGLLVALTNTTEREIRNRLADLVDWQLMAFDGEDVDLHALMRLYLRGRLSQAARENTLNAISHWYATQPIPPHPRTREQIAPRIRAVEHALEADNAELAAAILYSKPNPASFYILVEWLDRSGHMSIHIELASKLISAYNRVIREMGRRELRNNLAMAYNNRGLALCEQGKLDAAIEDYDQAIEIYTTLVHQEGRSELRNDLAGAYNNRGSALSAQGKLDAAIEDYDQAIEIYTTLVHQEGRSELVGNLESVLFNRGMTYLKIGQKVAGADDIESGGNLLCEAIKGGRRDLLSSFLQTVTARCALLDELGNPDLVARWANNALQWLLEAAEAGRIVPILQQRAPAFVAALNEHIDVLRGVGLGTDIFRRVEAALGLAKK